MGRARWATSPAIDSARRRAEGSRLPTAFLSRTVMGRTCTWKEKPPVVLPVTKREPVLPALTLVWWQGAHRCPIEGTLRGGALPACRSPSVTGVLRAVVSGGFAGDDPLLSAFPHSPIFLSFFSRADVHQWQGKGRCAALAPAAHTPRHSIVGRAQQLLPTPPPPPPSAPLTPPPPQGSPTVRPAVGRGACATANGAQAASTTGCHSFPYDDGAAACATASGPLRSGGGSAAAATAAAPRCSPPSAATTMPATPPTATTRERGRRAAQPPRSLPTRCRGRHPRRRVTGQPATRGWPAAAVSLLCRRRAGAPTGCQRGSGTATAWDSTQPIRAEDPCTSWALPA